MGSALPILKSLREGVGNEGSRSLRRKSFSVYVYEKECMLWEVLENLGSEGRRK